MPPPAARLAPQCGQVVACWSSLAEQAGHVLCMIAPSSAPSLVRLSVCLSTIGRQAISVVGPRATLGDRPAGEAETRCLPREEPGSSQTVNPAPLGRPLRTPAARPSWWEATRHDISARWWSPGSAHGCLGQLDPPASTENDTRIGVAMVYRRRPAPGH